MLCCSHLVSIKYLLFTSHVGFDRSQVEDPWVGVGHILNLSLHINHCQDAAIIVHQGPGPHVPIDPPTILPPNYPRLLRTSKQLLHHILQTQCNATSIFRPPFAEFVDVFHLAQ